eukprot:6181429-Pleurochrysis_carterae.AAC.1
MSGNLAGREGGKEAEPLSESSCIRDLAFPGRVQRAVSQSPVRIIRTPAARALPRARLAKVLDHHLAVTTGRVAEEAEGGTGIERASEAGRSKETCGAAKRILAFGVLFGRLSERPRLDTRTGNSRPCLPICWHGTPHKQIISALLIRTTAPRSMAPMGCGPLCGPITSMLLLFQLSIHAAGGVTVPCRINRW